MGHDVYQAEPASRAVFDQADKQLGFALSELCFNGPEDSLTDTANQQPALLVTSIAIWEAMKARNWTTPEYVAGHSLGEFSALVVSGSLVFDQALNLVRRRGELMKAAGKQEPGAMAAIIALGVDQIKTICARATESTGRPVQVANDNCPGQVVISGDREALDEAVIFAKEAGARKVVRLPITIAAHSALMYSAASEFAKAVDSTPINAPTVPIIGNVSGQPLTSPDEIRQELKAQLTAPVRWTESMNYLLDEGVDTFIEVGPGTVLLGLMKRINRKAARVQWDMQLDLDKMN
jgi:[acyl-carrier-protein] S-malonyltransferase